MPRDSRKPWSSMLRTHAASCRPAVRDSGPMPSFTLATCRDSSIARLPLCGAAPAQSTVISMWGIKCYFSLKECCIDAEQRHCSIALRESGPRPSLTVAIYRHILIALFPLCGAATTQTTVMNMMCRGRQLEAKCQCHTARLNEDNKTSFSGHCMALTTLHLPRPLVGKAHLPAFPCAVLQQHQAVLLGCVHRQTHLSLIVNNDSGAMPSLTLATCSNSSIARFPLCGATAVAQSSFEKKDATLLH